MRGCHAGRIQAAEGYLHEFESILELAQVSRYRYFNRYHLFLAELALARGEFAAVLVHTARASELAAANGMTKNTVKSWLLTGEALLALKRAEEAAQSLQQAVALADQLGHGSLRWKSRLRLAEAHARLGRSNADLYQQALALVNTTADGLTDEQLRATFLSSPLVMELRVNARSPIEASSAAVEEPTASDTYPVGLTAREVAVLRLVAQGATNRHRAASSDAGLTLCNVLACYSHTLVYGDFKVTNLAWNVSPQLQVVSLAACRRESFWTRTSLSSVERFSG